MTTNRHTEAAFETVIETHLLAHGYIPLEPSIPDGAFCLFSAPVEGTRQGKSVLVQLRDAVDPETGQRYTVKRYESEKTEDEGSWRHTKINLRPINPDFESIILTGADEGQLQVIAEILEVLGPQS
jgi:hypothetical protein